jgi:putative FmdB family regulatory protein
MPLYEYECDACEHRFEKIQKFSDPPVETCPACGGRVRKLLSSPAIQFKGSGWYITDYAKKGDGSKAPADPAKKTEGAPEKPAAASTEGSSSAPPKTESKKTESKSKSE